MIRRAWGRRILLAMALLAPGAAGPRGAARLEAATPSAEATPALRDLSVTEIRRRLAILQAEANAALADEDYDLEARLRRDMGPLEAEILRREREGMPTRPPDLRIRRP